MVVLRVLPSVAVLPVLPVSPAAFCAAKKWGRFPAYEAGNSISRSFVSIFRTGFRQRILGMRPDSEGALRFGRAAAARLGLLQPAPTRTPRLQSCCDRALPVGVSPLVLTHVFGTSRHPR